MYDNHFTITPARRPPNLTKSARVGQLRPKLVNSARSWPKLALFGSIVTRFGPNWIKFGPKREQLGKIWADVVEHVDRCANIAPTRLLEVVFDHFLSAFAICLAARPGERNLSILRGLSATTAARASVQHTVGGIRSSQSLQAPPPRSHCGLARGEKDRLRRCLKSRSTSKLRGAGWA